MTLSRRTPLTSKSMLKSNGKGLKSNTPLSSKSVLKSNSKLKSNKKILNRSKKQKGIDLEYKKTCIEIKRTREHKCTGCGCTETLTHSHLIPRSKREDLISEPKNITYHCIINGCHDKWESSDRVTLLDYDRNMQIVRELDREYYELLLMKQRDDNN